MTPQETEQGRMNLWDKAFTAALQVGKDVDECIAWAEKSVNAFETRFHKAIVLPIEGVVHDLVDRAP